MSITARYGTTRDKVKILIVDDLEDNLLSLEAILESLGQTIVRARSGEDAMRLALRNDFGLILLDVVMPGMDGFETASLLKRHHRTRDVPIIFLTAAEDSRDATFRGYAAGAADYITKPFDPWVLRAKVLVFIDLYRKDRALADVAARLESVEKQLRQLIRGAGPAGATAGAGLGGTPHGASPQALAELAGRIAALQATVRAALPAEDLAEAGHLGRLGGHRRVAGTLVP